MHILEVSLHVRSVLKALASGGNSIGNNPIGTNLCLLIEIIELVEAVLQLTG